MLRWVFVSVLAICHGCSYFEVNTSLGTKVIGHTMEFGTFFGVLDWKISVVPRKAPLVVNDETPSGVTLRGQFGYVGMSAQSFVADGMNEKGLIISVQTLYRSEYQHCNPLSKEYTTIWIARLPNWILSTFSTVAEVKAAISSGKYCLYNPVPGQSANSHWSIADAAGNSIVLEYERGQPKIYNNYVGVMTNDPPFVPAGALAASCGELRVQLNVPNRSIQLTASTPARLDSVPFLRFVHHSSTLIA
eukprot:Skav236533  [mRNA]  locus=scaffold78:1136428:1142062:- [translate_table: standard]